MSFAKIILGKQEISCEVHPNDQNVFIGKLLHLIDDKSIYRFWKDYEDAVNAGLLVEVDRLEGEMENFSFQVVVEKKLYKAKDVDLQIFVKDLDVSFKIS